MKNRAINNGRRLLALLLAAVMVFGLLPTAVFAEGNGITITVSGEDGVIAGASIQYAVSVDGENANTGTVTTNENGIAVIDVTAQAEAIAASSAVAVSYTVSAEGYEEKSGSINVTTLDLNTTVVLSKLQTQPESVTLSISKTNSGIIRINGVEVNDSTITVSSGELVLVEVIPETDHYIKALSIAGAQKTVEKGNSFTEEVVFEKDAAVSAVFSRDYKVSVGATGNGGDVTLNGQSVKELSVESSTVVTLKVTPKDGYVISSVTLNGTAEAILDKSSFEKTITVAADTEVAVAFVKTYTVTVSYGANGSVSLGQDTVTSGGTVAIEEGTRPVFKATPNEGFRVSAVEINGKTDTFDEHAYVYEMVLEPNKNYTVKVTFAQSTYTVTAADCDNGTIEIANEKVNHGADTVVTVEADEGYEINKVTVNGSQVTLDENNQFTIKGVKEDKVVSAAFSRTKYNVTVAPTLEHGKISVNQTVEHGKNLTISIEPDDGYTIDMIKINGKVVSVDEVTQASGESGATVVVKEVEEDQKIEATFKEVAPAELSDVTITKPIRLDEENALYIYAPAESVRVSSELGRIRINYAGDVREKTGTSSVSYSSNATITEIDLYYADEEAGESFKSWHSVTLEQPIQLVFDRTAPKVEMTPDEANGYGYYNSDVNVAVFAEDQDDYSGIAKVEYQVTCDNKVTKTRESIYESNGAISAVYEKADAILVDAKANDSDNVVLTVWVTDLAGNVTEESINLKILTTPPSVTVSFDDAQHSDAVIPEEADGIYYYDHERTATITITDRSGVFNGDNVKIELVGEDAPVSGVVWVNSNGERWTSEGDVHTAKVSFGRDTDADGMYQWELSYTNKAGLFDDEIAVTEGTEAPFAFVVDKKAPAASIEFSPLTKLLNGIKSALGLNFNTGVSVTVKSEDETSPVKAPLYYKSDLNDGLSSAKDDEALYAMLEKLYKDEEGAFSPEKPEITSDEKFEVYARVTDYAGNTCYVSTGGAVVDLTASAIELEVEEPEPPIYGKNIPVTVKVTEQGSGLASVTYTVTSNGAITKAGKVRLNEAGQGKITIIAVDNNAEEVVLTVKATDVAGNVSEAVKTFKISTQTPTVEISVDGTKNDNARDGYYTSRTAKVTIMNPGYAFDPVAATAAIQITAKDGNNNTLESVHTISKWTHDGNMHTATIKFEQNANYRLYFDQYTDQAGNTAWDAEVTGENPRKFTVDKTPTEDVTAKIQETTWEKLLEFLTFGLYDADEIKASVTANDKTSPVTIAYHIQYFEGDDATPLSEEELNKITFEDFDHKREDNSQKASCAVADDGRRFVVYFKVTDYAGNVRYVSTDGAIVDRTASTIVLTPMDYHSENGGKFVYNSAGNGKIIVDLNASDNSSGIQTVQYRIKGGDHPDPAWETVYKFDVKEPKYEQLEKLFAYKIEIVPSDYNYSDVVVEVKVTDNTGNESTDAVSLDIDITPPAIEIAFDNNVARNECYFDEARTATITITERTNHFDPEAATSGIKITAVDANGKDVVINRDEMISDWHEIAGETPDATTFKAKVSFTKDANYTFGISYTDDADNKNDEVTVTEGTVVPFAFTVDTKEPMGWIEATAENVKDEEGEKLTVKWEEIITDEESFGFGFWDPAGITLAGAVEDVTSPIESVAYYFSHADTLLTEEELEQTTWTALPEDTNWTDLPLPALDSEQKTTVYLKIVDMAGWTTYISTNGLIVDKTKPGVEGIAPVIKIEPEQPVAGVYDGEHLFNGDVTVHVTASDPISMVGDTEVYSGLKEISYRVLNMDKESQHDTLFEFKDAMPAKEELVQNWNSVDAKLPITVDSKKNNSNDVVVEVTAVDNAGNITTKCISLKIDVSRPEITVTYDNNNVDSGRYYKADREATIDIKERNFNPDDVEIIITNTDGVIPAVSSWEKTKEGTGNGDDTTYTAKIRYKADGDYTFGISYKDLAGNKDVTTYTGNNPTEFTIDQTPPSIRVAYDNNAAANGKYFNANRTATVTVTEHNFDVNRVKINSTATRGGVVPGVYWSHSGDTHVATIRYATDGDYTFDVTMTDMAGNGSGPANYGGSAAPKDFVIDTTFEDMITIEGVKDGAAYGYGKEVKPSVTISDINLDEYDVTLTGVQKNQKIDLTEEVNELLRMNGSTVRAVFDLFRNMQDMDGIYTLSLVSRDLAGNEDTEEIEFTVNRNGSVYVYNDTLQDLISNGGKFVQSVDGDLIITEYNANRLMAGSLLLEITRDGRPLDEVSYTVVPEINDRATLGESGWYEYNYTISRDNFASDGIYKIAVSSKYNTGEDKNNMREENSNYEDMDMLFRVDTAAPEISSITGLEEAIINATQSDVAYTIFDTIGLKAITVTVNGESTVITDFADDPNNYSGLFTLTERNDAQTVRIVVEDIAGNITDTDLFGTEDSEPAYAFNKSVTVSTNIFVRWYANTGLFWGSIIGAVVLVGGLWLLIAAGKKKKQKKAESVH